MGQKHTFFYCSFYFEHDRMRDRFETVPDRSDADCRADIFLVLARTHPHTRETLCVSVSVSLSHLAAFQHSPFAFMSASRSSASRLEAWEPPCGVKAGSLCPSWTRRISRDLRVPSAREAQ